MIPGKKKDQSSNKACNKRSKRAHGAAVSCNKGQHAKRSGSKAKKSSSKKRAAHKDGNASAKKTKNVMAGFKDARISDVSDKVFVATSPVHGKGLFAAKRIKANTVLGRLHGMPSVDDGIYVLWITDELGLELTNDFKYINHDSNPNAAYSDLDVMVLRDVEPGEELLHDYGW